jgi:hypothetical protein
MAKHHGDRAKRNRGHVIGNHFFGVAPKVSGNVFARQMHWKW